MSSTNPAAAAYPAPASSAAQGPYHMQAPPPAGYPTRDEPQNAVPAETKSKSEDFVKGGCTSSPAQGPYHMQAPPPAGYPTRDEPQNAVPVETKSKGDDFVKGSCCCTCNLEACF